MNSCSSCCWTFAAVSCFCEAQNSVLVSHADTYPVLSAQPSTSADTYPVLSAQPYTSADTYPVLSAQPSTSADMCPAFYKWTCKISFNTCKCTEIYACLLIRANISTYTPWLVFWPTGAGARTALLHGDECKLEHVMLPMCANTCWCTLSLVIPRDTIIHSAFDTNQHTKIHNHLSTRRTCPA
jgi:hypothetical protein